MKLIDKKDLIKFSNLPQIVIGASNSKKIIDWERIRFLEVVHKYFISDSSKFICFPGLKLLYV